MDATSDADVTLRPPGTGLKPLSLEPEPVGPQPSLSEPLPGQPFESHHALQRRIFVDDLRRFEEAVFWHQHPRARRGGRVPGEDGIRVQVQRHVLQDMGERPCPLQRRWIVRVQLEVAEDQKPKFVGRAVKVFDDFLVFFMVVADLLGGNLEQQVFLGGKILEVLPQHPLSLGIVMVPFDGLRDFGLLTGFCLELKLMSLMVS